jgi:kynurenine formamidase
MRLVDLSHTIEDGLITYKGLPAPVICDFWSRESSRAFYDDGAEFQIGRIEMVANTGTYLDGAYRRARCPSGARGRYSGGRFRPVRRYGAG